MTDLTLKDIDMNLDAEIAEKVMGWSIGHGDSYADDPDHEWRGVFDPEQQEFSGYGLTLTRHPYNWQSWAPQTSISDAWMVVEKMQRRTFSLSLQEHPQGWKALFWVMKGSENDASGFSVAETAPEAICKAALLALEK